MAIYKYILFDLDGTITDPKIGITKSIAYALKHFGIENQDLDILCKFIGPPLRDSFECYYEFNKDMVEIAVQKYREYFIDKGLYENTVYENIEKVFKTLRKKDKTLIIATSKPTVYAKTILGHFDLLKYFDFVAGSELNGDRAVKSEVITYALNQNGISNLKEVIMIGDREYDIIGAKQVGLSSIGVLYGYGSRCELENVGADYVVETVEDLLTILL